jgi:hypothetical protein
MPAASCACTEGWQGGASRGVFSDHPRAVRPVYRTHRCAKKPRTGARRRLIPHARRATRFPHICARCQHALRWARAGGGVPCAPRDLGVPRLPPPRPRRPTSASVRAARPRVASAACRLAMVVMQPWLWGRCLRLGATAQVQHYVSNVLSGAPPPTDPRVPSVICPDAPSSHPCHRNDNICTVCAANCAGAAANGAAGTAPMPDGAAAVAATTTALSSRAAAAFCRFCGVLNLGKVCWVCA